MSRQVVSFLEAALREGKRAALVTVTGSRGSYPGVVGGMMAVLEDGGFMGTIGGGAVEAEVQRRCVEAIREGQGMFEFQYDLNRGSDLGMICGGHVEGFARIFQSENRLFVFGGGHCGQKLAAVGLECGFNVTVADNRELDVGKFPPVQLVNADFEAFCRELEGGPCDYAVIVTRGHAFDYQVLRAIIEKPFAYIGMIGSRSKVADTFLRLRAEGIAGEMIEKVYAPVGIDIDDGSPGEIAVAVLAEILLVKNGGRLRSSRERMKEM